MASLLFRLTRLAAAALRSQTLNRYQRPRPLTAYTRPCPSTVKTDVQQVDRSNSIDSDKSFNDALLKASSLQILMRLADKRNMSLPQAISMIAALGRLISSSQHTAAVTSITGDPSFVQLCLVMDRGIYNARDASLLSTLQHLYAIDLPPDHRLMETVDTDMLRRIRKLSLRHLIQLLALHAPHQHTELQRRVVAEVQEKIHQRWFEISEQQEITGLLRLSDHFNADFLGRLEDRTMELAPQLTAEDLQRLLTVLAERRLRPTHLLRALAFHLTKSTQRLSVKHMSNVVHAASALNFPDAVLLRRISDDLLQEVTNVTKSSLIAAFLTGFALMELITEWIAKNAAECRPQDLVAYVLTAARVNFVPAEAETLLPSLVALVPRDSIATKYVWLDLVWSLAVLQCATADQLASVLDPTFYRELVANPSHNTHNIKKKILGVYAVATVEMNTYKGSTSLDESIFDDCFVSTLGGAICSSVLDTLSNSIPKGKFLSGPKVLPSGIPIDGEFIVSKDGKPLAFEEAATSGGRLSTESLPQGARRIALLVHEFKDFTLNNIQLVGHKSVIVRILEKLGYSVMQVPHMEYNIHSPTVKRLQYLQQKINDCFVKPR